MYASVDSIELSDIQIKALNRLFEIGYRYKEYDCIIKAQDYLIPKEYNALRWS